MATTYSIEISDPTYDDNIIFQIPGKAVLEYPQVKTMDMLRGSTLKMQLEASVTDTYQQRLIETVGDKKLPVTLYKDGDVFWNGFIKPDGIVESFVTDYWIINVQAIDGLGLLENIKFLNSDGYAYQGAMSEIDILVRCLELTGLDMQFRLYNMNLYYSVDENAPVTTNTAIKTTYVNTDRYANDDQEGSVFTAKEVLESLLKKYGAFITQQNNQWHIVRIIDYYADLSGQPYDLYESDGTYVNSYTALNNLELGSDIDGYNPCHAGANQQRNYKAALGAYKVYYEYGLVKSILENPKIYFNDGVGDIDGWNVETSLSNFNFELKDAIPEYPSGYYECQMIPEDDLYTVTEALSYDYTNYDNDVIGSQTLSVSIKTFTYLFVPIFNTVTKYWHHTRITLIGDSGTVYYLNSSGEWTLSTVLIQMFQYIYYSTGENEYKELTNTFNIKANGLPEDGTINVEFILPNHNGSSQFSYTVIKNVSIEGVDLDIKGESWTSQRNYEGNGTATAIVETEDKIYVGDSVSDLYIGAIEDSSNNNTLYWSKTVGGVIDETKQLPLLNWLSRDRLTISGGNATIFKGGVLGYLPYLSVIKINNIDGIFMCIAYKYDLEQDRIEASFERIFNDDIYSDVSVKYQLESDNVISPAIE